MTQGKKIIYSEDEEEALLSDSLSRSGRLSDWTGQIFSADTSGNAEFLEFNIYRSVETTLKKQKHTPTKKKKKEKKVDSLYAPFVSQLLPCLFLFFFFTH